MENQKQIQILNKLLEINNDRIVIYTLVKNEIIYQDLKIILNACIQNSLMFKSQLTAERKKIASQINFKSAPNQDFFNVWLVINECLSLHKHRKISSLFTASEKVFITTYANALNEDNLKHLSSTHKSLILRQNDLLKAS